MRQRIGTADLHQGGEVLVLDWSFHSKLVLVEEDDP